MILNCEISNPFWSFFFLSNTEKTLKSGKNLLRWHLSVCLSFLEFLSHFGRFYIGFCSKSVKLSLHYHTFVDFYDCISLCQSIMTNFAFKTNQKWIHLNDKLWFIAYISFQFVLMVILWIFWCLYVDLKSGKILFAKIPRTFLDYGWKVTLLWIFNLKFKMQRSDGCKKHVNFNWFN